MQGTRLHKSKGVTDLPYRISLIPGAYGSDNGKDWYCCTPNGLFGNISGHQVTEHADGTITVSPSILCTASHEGKSYHGYLEKGVWRKC